MSDAILRLAEIRRCLKPGEFLLLFDLVLRANGAREVACSSRDLARSTGFARKTVQQLIDQLNIKWRGILETVPGPGRLDPSIHRLLFLREATSRSRPRVLGRAASAGGGAR